MKNCSYKSILARAFDKVPQLPISPNAYFGTVMHKVLERIAKEAISTESTLNEVFLHEISVMEEILRKYGYDFFIPLQKNVHDFGIRKILLKRHIRNNSNAKKMSSTCKLYLEKWISTKDNIVGGKVDLLLESDSYTEIVDFKTGAILQDFLDDSGEVFSEIKSEYLDQLKLYAYAYYETTDHYPDKLTLVDLAKQKFDIPFTPGECHDLYESAKSLLNEANRSIDSGDFNAVISEENCKFCLYRPSCNYYNSYLEVNPPFGDVYGTLVNVARYQNGNISLFIQNSLASYVLTGITPTNYDELQSKKGRVIGVYNLKKETGQNVYSSRKTTVIYEQ